MNPIQKRIMHWIFFIGTILLLIGIYSWCEQIKIDDKIASDTLYDDVWFYCNDNYAVPLKKMADDTYYVYLPSFADASNLKVSIENAKVNFITEDDTISVYKNRKNACSFQTETEYAMVFYDQKDNIVAEADVVFMASANLPTVYIETESGSFDMIDDDKAYSEGAVFSLVTAEGETQYGNIIAEISARGNHTFGFEKKSYQFDLMQECNLLDMGESSTWILLCNSFDLSNVRNKITLDMAIAAGMDGSPKSEFVDVYFNNVYHGTYLLCEKVEFGDNRIDYTDMESKNMALNGTKLNFFETFSVDEGVRKGYLLPETPDDITGGYLLEHDYGDKFGEETSGFKTMDNECYVIKNPKHATPDEVEYIATLFQEIEDAIKSEDGYNPYTGKHYSEYIDVKSWADKYIIEEFCKNHGGGCTSSYFYKLPDEISTKVYGGPVWDYDKAYGRNGGPAGTTNDLNFLTLHSNYTNWFYYLYQHEDFREMLFDEYQNVFAPYIENEMMAEIDYYSEILKPSLKLNFHRFADMYVEDIEVDTAYYDGDVDFVRQFINARKATLDKIWGEEKETCIVRFEGTKEKNRCIAVEKGDVLQIVLNEWEFDGNSYYWIDSETGEEIVVGMVIDHDILAELKQR